MPVKRVSCVSGIDRAMGTIFAGPPRLLPWAMSLFQLLTAKAV
jgi:hypothetical protein